MDRVVSPTTSQSAAPPQFAPEECDQKCEDEADCGGLRRGEYTRVNAVDHQSANEFADGKVLIFIENWL